MKIQRYKKWIKAWNSMRDFKGKGDEKTADWNCSNGINSNIHEVVRVAFTNEKEHIRIYKLSDGRGDCVKDSGAYVIHEMTLFKKQ